MKKEIKERLTILSICFLVIMSLFFAFLDFRLLSDFLIDLTKHFMVN